MSVAAADPREAAVDEAVCAHCGEPLARSSGRFCCGGCAAAYRLIQELGLERYYGGRHHEPTQRPPRPPDEPAADAAAYAATEADGTMSLQLLVDGLHCAA